REALDAGASMVNDVWGLTADPEMAKVVARYGVPVVLAHNQHGTEYRNLVSEVIFWLKRGAQEALDAGIRWENIIVDPGIGFGKTREQNLELLDRLDELKVLGLPILLGTSRKFGYGHKMSWQAERRIEASAATTAIGIARGADIVRAHDVHEMARAIKVADSVVGRKWR
ncbi:MAG: dihydropteroate synthase, partial [Chloroflexi bacterium]|nr:dihydropteroate synthase [Chloroflexota bacterium]